MRATATAFGGFSVWVAIQDSNSVTRLRASDGSRNPHQKHPQPRKPDGVGSVPSVTARWWSSRDAVRRASSHVSWQTALVSVTAGCIPLASAHNRKR